jgi:hypothetical protein
MQTLRKIGYSPLVEIALILVIAAVTYLPNLSKATIYRDDWYYAMDRTIGGPGVFQEMFRIDRPARGPLFEIYYRLFGIQPLPYHMSSFFWRVLGGLAALWLFRQLWPRQRLATFVMALFFVLYPGYQRWMEGFENQPRIISSFLEVLSIALTVFAVATQRKVLKFLAWTASILLGWAHIALVDFSFGMEVFRFLCVFLMINRGQETRSFGQKTLSAFRAWGIAIVIPVGYLFWRLFIFHNERPATDIGLQLSQLVATPFVTGAWWLLRLFQSVVNVAILAWGAPFFQNFFEITLPDILIGMLLAGTAVVFFWVSISILTREDHISESGADSGESWQSEAIRVGLLGVVAGVLPVIVANRYVSFGPYSHYALPASLAAAMLMVGVIFLFNSPRVRFGAAAVLILLAVLTHYVVSLRVLYEEQVIANFWHQVVWRAPGIKSGTTLFVYYPTVDYAEDVDAVAGPANFIYFPEQTNQIPAVYPLFALPQMEYTTKYAIRGGTRTDGYRTHVGRVDYGNMLVINQPTQNSCVHVIDSKWPRHSNLDSDQILLLGQFSKIGNVATGGSAPHPAEFIFGPEPAHTWCYYYEKAELALQEGAWDKIVQIGDQVTQLQLGPEDRVEWAPFLQAYAWKGDETAFKSTTVKVQRFPLVHKEICNALLKMQETGSTFSPGIQSVIDEKICHK